MHCPRATCMPAHKHLAAHACIRCIARCLTPSNKSFYCPVSDNWCAMLCGDLLRIPCAWKGTIALALFGMGACTCKPSPLQLAPFRGGSSNTHTHIGHATSSIYNDGTGNLLLHPTAYCKHHVAALNYKLINKPEVQHIIRCTSGIHISPVCQNREIHAEQKQKALALCPYKKYKITKTGKEFDNKRHRKFIP